MQDKFTEISEDVNPMHIDEDYAKNQMGLDFKTNKYRVYNRSHNGINCAFLQYYNSVTKVWSLYYHNEDIGNYAPKGISIEGIKVRSRISQYGFDENYFAVINCVGESSPTTNVARNDLEGGIALKEMYEFIYGTFFDSCISQLSDLRSNNSLTWATIVINHSINMLYYNLFRRMYVDEEVGALSKILENVECIPIDNGKEINLVSLNTSPDKVLIIDSKAFNSAVFLLQDVNVTNKTAYGLLSELDNHEIKDESILLMNSVASCVRNLFLRNFEIVAIEADENHRRIQFTWSKKKNNWIYMDYSYSSNIKHVFIVKDVKSLSIEGMEGKAYIVSGDCVFIVKESPLLDYLLRLNNDFKTNENMLKVMYEMICDLFSKYEVLNEHEMDKFITKEIINNSDIGSNINRIEDVKKAFKGYNTFLLNIGKYYWYDKK